MSYSRSKITKRSHTSFGPIVARYMLFIVCTKIASFLKRKMRDCNITRFGPIVAHYMLFMSFGPIVARYMLYTVCTKISSFLKRIIRDCNASGAGFLLFVVTHLMCFGILLEVKTQLFTPCIIYRNDHQVMDYMSVHFVGMIYKVAKI